MPNPETTDQLEALAVRCEQAAGQSLELDHEIGRALSTNGNYSYRPYTASVDAALTLVPEGALWEVGHKVNYPAAAGEPNMAYYAGVGIGGIPAHWEYAKSCASAALALTAAALRASKDTSHGR